MATEQATPLRWQQYIGTDPLILGANLPLEELESASISCWNYSPAV